MISCTPIADGKSGTLLDFIEDRQNRIAGNLEQQEAFLTEVHNIGLQLAFDEAFSSASLDRYPICRGIPGKRWMRKFHKWLHRLTPAEQVRIFSMEVHWL